MNKELLSLDQISDKFRNVELVYLKNNVGINTWLMDILDASSNSYDSSIALVGDEISYLDYYNLLFKTEINNVKITVKTCDIDHYALNLSSLVTEMTNIGLRIKLESNPFVRFDLSKEIFIIKDSEAYKDLTMITNLIHKNVVF